MTNEEKGIDKTLEDTGPDGTLIEVSNVAGRRIERPKHHVVRSPSVSVLYVVSSFLYSRK